MEWEVRRKLAGSRDEGVKHGSHGACVTPCGIVCESCGSPEMQCVVICRKRSRDSVHRRGPVARIRGVAISLV
jgi:hypothetical protein